MINSDYWYLASYPKSGNTWCRIFIAELTRSISKKNNGLNNDFELNKDLNTGDSISSRIWIDDQIGIESSDLKKDELEKIRYLIGKSKRIYAEGLRYHKVHDAYFNKFNKDKSTVCTDGCKGAIYLIRNPFDICISLSKFLNWDIQTCVDVLTDKEMWLNDSKKGSSFHVSQFLGSWESHANSWINQNDIPVLLIRYEDLIYNPMKYFSKVASFLNITEDEKLISQAIENSSFANLKKKENNEGGFVESPYGCKEFFRKGVVGDGLRLLSKNQLSHLKNQFKDSLIRYQYI